MGLRMREDNGRGERIDSRLPSSRGQAIRLGVTEGPTNLGSPLRGMEEGMGPRIREDNGRGRG